MAAKRLGSPLDEQSQDNTNTNKKLKIDVPPVKAFCGISDITPQTSTLQQPPDTSSVPTVIEPDAAATPSRLNNTPTEVWVAVELFTPTDPPPDSKPLVKILGVFTNVSAALSHAEEHVRALRTVTTYGVRSEPEEVDDRDSDAMSETSVYERKLEIFRDMYEGDEEEDREDGGKCWIVRWGNVTEVWVEKRSVLGTKEEAGYHTPLPVLGCDDRD